MLQRLQKIEERIPYYEGMIAQIREIHPGMGLRTIYEKTQPEGIGRDHFIDLGIRLGLCMDPVTNRKRTTYVHRGSRYTNLLVGIDFTDVNQVWATDITYFRISDVFYYISLIMDL
jgi:putative transposase